MHIMRETERSLGHRTLQICDGYLKSRRVHSFTHFGTRCMFLMYGIINTRYIVETRLFVSNNA